MHRKCTIFTVICCFVLCIGSLALAGDRSQNLARSGSEATQITDSPRAQPVASGPISVHRFVRQHLQYRYLRLAFELRLAPGIPVLPIYTNGLSDDPDPTGMGDDDGESSGEQDDDYQGGADDSDGTNEYQGLDHVRTSD